MSDPSRLLKRKSSAGQRPVSIKRQRIPTKKFEFEEKPTKRRRRAANRVLVYRKGSFLAIRAGKGDFFLGQTNQHVYEDTENFRLQWLQQDAMKGFYHFSYNDQVQQACVVGTVHLDSGAGGRVKLHDGEKLRILTLLQAAEEGTNVDDLDTDLFQPISSKRKVASAEDTLIHPVKKKPKNEKKEKKRVKKSKKQHQETPRVVSTKVVKPLPPMKSRSDPIMPNLGRAKTVLLRSNSKTKSPDLKKATSLPTLLQHKPSLLKGTTTVKTSDNTQGKKSSRKSQGERKTKEKKEKKKTTPKEKKIREKKPPKPKVDRTDPNRKLVPNLSVKTWDKDPMLETREDVPFISTNMHSKLLFRAVKLKDIKMLKSLIEDKKQVSTVKPNRSYHDCETPLLMAIRMEYHDAMNLLLEELYGNNSEVHARAPETHSLLTTQSTGSYNPRSLGKSAVRKVQMARGGKEGNNALTKDLKYYSSDSEFYHGVAHNVSLKTLNLVTIKLKSKWQLNNCIVVAIRNGNRKLAAQLIEESEKEGGVGFNKLHKEALVFDKQDWKETLRESSVTKKPDENRKVLPIHCAAVNPNPKYLAKLFGVVPEYNIEDADKRRPIHYAAACTGTGPLELIISKGVSLEEADSDGLTALHIACITGRPDNVKLLLNKVHNQLKNTLDLPPEELSSKKAKSPYKFGPGNVNKPLKKCGRCPIHFAVPEGHKDVVEVLLEFGADINKGMNAQNNKVTPLMMAANGGDLAMVRFLVDHKAHIERRDKLQRTALIHAVRDGRAHVASYLLQRGADPNVADSSGNTAMHYAAAYGWYFCFKVLLDAGANPDTPNDWKLTPMGVSYLKGNRGLTQIIMDLPNVNINFQDKDGNTVLMNSMKCRPMTVDIYTQVQDLIVKKNADVSICNKKGQNALHMLVEETIYYLPKISSESETKEVKDTKQVVIKVAKLLMDHGCDPKLRLPNGQNALFLAIDVDPKTWYMDLIKLLLKKVGLTSDMSEVSEEHPGQGSTLLHIMALKTNFSDLMSLDNLKMMLEFMAKHKCPSGGSGMQVLNDMAHVKNLSYETPFIVLCKSYKTTTFYKYMNNAHWDLMKALFKFFVEDLKSELHYTVKKCKPDPQDSEKEIITTEVHISYDVLLQSNERLETGQDKYPSFNALLQYKPNLDIRRTDGCTMLMANIEDADKVEHLLKCGAEVNLKSDNSFNGGMTALLLALKNRIASVVHILLRRGASVNVINRDTGETPLHLLVKDGRYYGGDYLPLVTTMLDKGVDVNATDNKGHTVLHLVAEQSTDSADEAKDVEQLLLRRGADPFAKSNTGRMPLHYIFGKFEKNINLRRADPVESFLIFASAMRYQQIDIPDKQGLTPLHLAAMRGATVCCMMLVQKGCNINALTNISNSALGLAVIQAHDSCALTLMQKGADINRMIITDPNADKKPDDKDKNKPKHEEWEVWEDDESTDIQKDISQGHSSSYMLVPKLKRDMSEGTKLRHTLHTQLRSIQKKQVWRWNSSHFEIPWQPKPRGHPIFQFIVQNGWQGLTYIAMDLLEPFGMKYASAVEIALRIGKYRFAHSLMQKQMDFAKLKETNSDQQTLLHVLAATDDGQGLIEMKEKIWKMLVEEVEVDINAQDHRGMTALHYAVWNVNDNLINYLLDNEATDASITDKYGRNALAAAFFKLNRQSFGNNGSILKNFQEKGALLNHLYDFPPLDWYRGGFQPDIHPEQESSYFMLHKHRASPLAVTVCLQQHNAVKSVLQAGADVNLQDEKGMTVAMYAVKLKDCLTLRLLLTHKGEFDIDKWQAEKNKQRESILKGLKKPAVQTDDDLFAGIKLTKLTSNLNLKIKDKQGMTVMHHLMSALPVGVYEDAEIIKLLVTGGASLKEKDKKGRTVLDMALAKKSPAKALQALHWKPKASWMVPNYEKPTVDDGLNWADDPPDYKADAAAFLKKKEEEEEELEVEGPRATPDHRVQLQNGEVIVDEGLDMPFDVLLMKVDARVGQFGIYNFYKMQLLHDKVSDLIILFTCWGRIGDQGMFQKTPYGNVEEASQEFASIFKSKSGNEWKNVNHFEILPKKYRLVDTDQRRHYKLPEVRFNLDKSPIPSRLPPYVQDMMLELSNVKMLSQSTYKTGIDIPFGRLKRDTLMKAHELLKQMFPLAEEKDKLSIITVENIEKYYELSDKLAQLSTEYYYLMPQHGYQLERLPILESVYQLQEHARKLQDMLELEHAGLILMGAAYKIKEMNPLDYIYRALGIQIEVLDENAAESRLLMKYIYSSSNPSVEAIYRVSRQGEQARLDACSLDNRQMLWHGSRTSNLISILSKGLLIAPKEAPRQGCAYGQGIYTSNCFIKSESYCYNDGGGQSKFMLLCEVALGEVKGFDQPIYMEAPHSGFNSTRGNGSRVPDPGFNARLPSGAIIPVGPLVDFEEPFVDINYSYRGGYHEFIVYDEAQVCLRYIVQFR